MVASGLDGQKDSKKTPTDWRADSKTASGMIMSGDAMEVEVMQSAGYPHTGSVLTFIAQASRKTAFFLHSCTKECWEMYYAIPLERVGRVSLR